MTDLPDADTGGKMLSQHKTYMTVGHSEYWSAGMRTAVTDARNGGANLAFFPGNLMYWKIRFTSSQASRLSNLTVLTMRST